MTYCAKCDKSIDTGTMYHWTVKLMEPLDDPRPGRTSAVGSMVDLCESCAFEMEDDGSGEIVID